ncbi:MAG: squalene cyclase [Desulfovibrio sp.]|nr:squalene cyclase [Desulfovibrio sp.]
MANAVSHRMSHNNLHIKCAHFTETQAHTVMGLLHQFHTQCNRIFIDVEGIEQPGHSAAETFKQALSASSIAPEQIFFKGAGGFTLAINGNRVIIPKPASRKSEHAKGHTCCGKCQHCHCHKHE